MLERRLLIVTGKGGVGRSALAAALALRAVRAGKQVLAIAMTDDVGLAAHLGLERLHARPREVRPGLAAQRIHRPSALDEYLRLQLHVPRVTRMGPLARAFDVFAVTVPGVREVITIGKVLHEARSGPWDLVIADAPPVGQIGSYLRAPKTVADLVPAGRIRGQAGWMVELLADPARSGLVVVTIPEELPVAETNEALARLDDLRLIETVAVVANRVLEPLDVEPGRLEELPDGPLREAARLHDRLTIAQQHWLEKLPAGPRLPFLFGMMTAAEVSARLADEWVEP